MFHEWNPSMSLFQLAILPTYFWGVLVSHPSYTDYLLGKLPAALCAILLLWLQVETEGMYQDIK